MNHPPWVARHVLKLGQLLASLHNNNQGSLPFEMALPKEGSQKALILEESPNVTNGRWALQIKEHSSAATYRPTWSSVVAREGLGFLETAEFELWFQSRKITDHC